ncbi:MAG: hypothetical protein EOP86_00025 [Verrucomicrobiaceae bacterium]|nr:MAG: hypothetical protein EOP86_00025 [Verrucomicrobiaceae bacterium]
MKQLLPLLAGLSLVSSAFGASQAIIKSGGIVLGINPEGHLNVSNVYGLTSNSGATGLTLIGVGDATSPGCYCEGWGVSGSGVSGYANVDTDGGAHNLSVVSFDTDDAGSGPGTYAKSVVAVGGSDLQVTQHYAAAAAAPGSLFADTVTITNTGADVITDVKYVRVMDWDIPPTEFSELVTIQGTATTTLLETSHDNGFNTANPLGGDFPIDGSTTNADFTDNGPNDHGAYFRFNFGDLAPGESKDFTIFYGAAANESEALAALGSVGVELYSLGQNNQIGHDDQSTFIFGFKGVGGTVIVPPPSNVPEGGIPVVLFGSLVGGMILFKRRLT